jgi:hypothetical protein
VAYQNPVGGKASVAATLVCLSHLDTRRGSHPDRSLLNSFEYTAYFSWQSIGTASATVGFVVHVASVGEFIFTELWSLSVKIIPPLFFALSSITDAETLLKVNTSLNKTQKIGTASFVSTYKLQILFRLIQEGLPHCQCSLASSSVSGNITMLDFLADILTVSIYLGDDFCQHIVVQTVSQHFPDCAHHLSGDEAILLTIEGVESLLQY